MRCKNAGKDDIIVIAGKGDEDYQKLPASSTTSATEKLMAQLLDEV